MPPFRRASCHLVLASSQSAVTSCCCLFDNLGHSSGHLVSSRVGLSWTNVQHVYPSGSLMFKIWKRVIPIHSSERATLFSRHPNNRSACEALSMIVLVCLIFKIW